MNDEIYLLAGTYTDGESEGIYVYRFNTLTGDSEYISMIQVENPSYMAVSSDKKYVYSVSENEENPAYLNAFSFDAEAGRLTFLNRQETKGAAPCYVSVDKDNTHAVVANYGGGSITVFELSKEGRIIESSQLIKFEGQGADEERQEAPHLHCVIFSPDEKFLFATDLGTDKIYRFQVDKNSEIDFINDASLMLFRLDDGSGPRHLEFHPSGNFLYVVNELSSSIVCYNYEDGNLLEMQTEKIDQSETQGGGDIAISPDGRFLYASKREYGDGVAIFFIDASTGELCRAGYQQTSIHPRNINVTPNGKFLLVANKDSNLIEVFEINSYNGLLKKLDKDISLDMPVCIEFI